ncbi:MAG TPA: hypothetical protein VNT32_00050 [Thermoleophilaceae bacterium]|nr:hypothetical protein [Thermoleophilaceae bacterium]
MPVRRSAGERLAAWLVTGPLGHLAGVLADLVSLWARYGWARARGRSFGA